MDILSFLCWINPWQSVLTFLYHLLPLSFSFFNAFYWSIVALWCCVNSQCTAKWISHTYISPSPFWLSPSHSGHHGVLSRVPCAVHLGDWDRPIYTNDNCVWNIINKNILYSSCVFCLHFSLVKYRHLTRGLPRPQSQILHPVWQYPFQSSGRTCGPSPCVFLPRAVKRMNSRAEKLGLAQLCHI